MGWALYTNVFIVFSLLKWHLEIKFCASPFHKKKPVLETPALIQEKLLVSHP